MFHSTQSANLPTAETLDGGSWLFEISYRFQPPVSGGADALWGLDGPVVNGLALAYGRDAMLFMLAVAGGVAWNTELPDLDGLEDNETQAYAQLIFDVRPAPRIAVGLVPRGRGDLEHDAGTFGLELETGGHFFKLVLTNSTRMNPTQFLGGTPHPFEADAWRLGFNVARLLQF